MRRLWTKGGLAFGLVCGFLLLGLVANAASQPETPEEVVAVAIDALYTGDFELYSSLMHSEALESFRAIFDPALELLSDDEQEEALAILFGASSLEEYRSMPARDVFAHMLAQFAPFILEFYTEANATVLGHVMEGDHTAHVVYRMTGTAFGVEASTVEVISLQLDEGRWRMLLTADFEGLGALFGF